MVLYPTTVASIKGLIGRLEQKAALTVAASYLQSQANGIGG
jgi:hypothetical protein